MGKSRTLAAEEEFDRVGFFRARVFTPKLSLIQEILRVNCRKKEVSFLDFTCNVSLYGYNTTVMRACMQQQNINFVEPNIKTPYSFIQTH